MSTLFGLFRVVATAAALSAIGFAMAARQTQRDDDYTITTVARLAKPYDLRAMNDEFQSAKLLSESGGVGTFRITYKPFHVQTVTADPNWRRDDAGMTEYLKPRLAANWDSGLRRQILSDLRADGIDPNNLDDKTLVEKVSSWALRRSTFNSQFGLWMVEFRDGRPVVPMRLAEAFRENEPAHVPKTTLFERELFGKGMYLNKTHGACTSTSTYLATVLRRWASQRGSSSPFRSPTPTIEPRWR
jgi:hypothetical protein